MGQREEGVWGKDGEESGGEEDEDVQWMVNEDCLGFFRLMRIVPFEFF